MKNVQEARIERGLRNEPQCKLDEGLSSSIDFGSGFASDSNTAVSRRMGSHRYWLKPLG
jgi:hypothetical protein